MRRMASTPSPKRLLLGAIGTLVAVWCTALSPLAARAGCEHEHSIEKLRRAMAENPPTANQADARAKRLMVIQQIHDLDVHSRFTLTVDQDYKATLKFDTPEEQLRNAILQLIDWVSWLETGGMGDVAYAGRTLDEIKQARENLGYLKNAIDKYGKFTASRQQQKGKFEEMLQEFRTQAKIRGDAIAGLTRLADLTACQSMTPAELALVGLYHDGIRNNPSCSDYEKKVLADRVHQASSGPAFGSLLDPDVYASIKRNCRIPSVAATLEGDATERLDPSVDPPDRDCTTPKQPQLVTSEPTWASRDDVYEAQKNYAGWRCWGWYNGGQCASCPEGWSLSGSDPRIKVECQKQVTPTSCK